MSEMYLKKMKNKKYINTMRKYGNACLDVVFIENSPYTHAPQLDVHVQQKK